MSYKQMLVYKKLRICYAHWAGIQEKWVTLSGVWKANGSTENWTVDIVWIIIQIIIELETRFSQTACWDEFVELFCCGLWLMFRQHQIQEKVSADMLSGLFWAILCWIMLNLWLIFSSWLIESGFPPVWWVELWVGPFLMGLISQSWRAKHKSLQMIITTPDVFTAFQRGNWVYYL